MKIMDQRRKIAKRSSRSISAPSPLLLVLLLYFLFLPRGSTGTSAAGIYFVFYFSARPASLDSCDSVRVVGPLASCLLLYLSLLANKLTFRMNEGRLLANAPTWHHLVVARGSVHIHRDIEALYPHLAHGFTLQSELRCGTYPLSIHRQQHKIKCYQTHVCTALTTPR